MCVTRGSCRSPNRLPGGVVIKQEASKPMSMTGGGRGVAATGAGMSVVGWPFLPHIAILCEIAIIYRWGEWPYARRRRVALEVAAFLMPS